MMHGQKNIKLLISVPNMKNLFDIRILFATGTKQLQLSLNISMSSVGKQH